MTRREGGRKEGRKEGRKVPNPLAVYPRQGHGGFWAAPSALRVSVPGREAFAASGAAAASESALLHDVLGCERQPNVTRWLSPSTQQ